MSDSPGVVRGTEDNREDNLRSAPEGSEIGTEGGDSDARRSGPGHSNVPIGSSSEFIHDSDRIPASTVSTATSGKDGKRSSAHSYESFDGLNMVAGGEQQLTWECARCTLINPVSAKECEVCLTKRSDLDMATTMTAHTHMVMNTKTIDDAAGDGSAADVKKHLRTQTIPAREPFQQYKKQISPELTQGNIFDSTETEIVPLGPKIIPAREPLPPPLPPYHRTHPISTTSNNPSNINRGPDSTLPEVSSRHPDITSQKSVNNPERELREGDAGEEGEGEGLVVNPGAVSVQGPGGDQAPGQASWTGDTGGGDGGVGTTGQNVVTATLVEEPVVAVATALPNTEGAEENSSTESDDGLMKLFQRHLRLLVFAAVALFAIVLTLAVAIPLSLSTGRGGNGEMNGSDSGNNNPNTQNDDPSLIRANAIKSALALVYPTREEENEWNDKRDNGPQALAFKWIVDEDRAVLSLTNEERIIQRYILALLYFATAGDGWRRRYDFLSPQHECLWNGPYGDDGISRGVRCNTNRYLSKIELGKNDLAGTLPTEIGSLTSLTHLDLSSNQLFGTIPTYLGLLSSTVFSDLNLSENLFSGFIPAELGGLAAMSSLMLYDNKLNGMIPSALADISDSLEYLRIEENDVTGDLLSLCSAKENAAFSSGKDIDYYVSVDKSQVHCPCCQCCDEERGEDATLLLPSSNPSVVIFTQATDKVSTLAPTIQSYMGVSSSPTVALSDEPTGTPTPQPTTRRPTPRPTRRPVSSNAPPPTEIIKRPSTPRPTPRPTRRPVFSNAPPPTEIIKRPSTSRPTFRPTLRPVSSNAPPPTESVTFAETSRIISIRNIVKAVSGSIPLDTATSSNNPHRKALQWIAIDDEAQIPLAKTNRIIQRYILAVLYYSLGGMEWKGQYDFLSLKHECEWRTKRYSYSQYRGIVSCNEMSQVSDIQFDQVNNIRGTLPKEIGYLDKLTILSVGSNLISGSLPSTIGLLTNLVNLNLSANRLTGQIPTEVGNLSLLTTFDLMSNSFTGTIPYEVGAFDKVTHFLVQRNELIGTVPRSFLDLTSVISIQLFENELSGNINFLCDGLKQLIYLQVDEAEMVCKCCY